METVSVQSIESDICGVRTTGADTDTQYAYLESHLNASNIQTPI